MIPPLMVKAFRFSASEVASVAVALSLAGLYPARAAPRIMVYSDLCTERESGDTAGHRVTVRWRTGAPRITYEWTEGQLDGPVEAKNVSYARRSRLPTRMIVSSRTQ